MRFLKYIIPFLFIALFLSFCEFPRKALVRTVENSELIGKWNQMNTDEIVGDNDINIKHIQLVNDSVAKISFIDSAGARLVMGKWVNGYKKELKNKALDIKLDVTSDIKITFWQNKNQLYHLLIMLSEKDNKLTMTGYNLVLEKE